MHRGMLQKCNRISEDFYIIPTRRIEEPARGFEDRGVIVQQVHSSSLSINRNHVHLLDHLWIWSAVWLVIRCFCHYVFDSSRSRPYRHENGFGHTQKSYSNIVCGSRNGPTSQFDASSFISRTSEQPGATPGMRLFCVSDQRNAMRP